MLFVMFSAISDGNFHEVASKVVLLLDLPRAYVCLPLLRPYCTYSCMTTAANPVGL